MENVSEAHISRSFLPTAPAAQPQCRETIIKKDEEKKQRKQISHGIWGRSGKGKGRKLLPLFLMVIILKST